MAAAFLEIFSVERRTSSQQCPRGPQLSTVKSINVFKELLAALWIHPVQVRVAQLTFLFGGSRSRILAPLVLAMPAGDAFPGLG